jgi:hypothetical protein
MQAVCRHTNLMRCYVVMLRWTSTAGKRSFPSNQTPNIGESGLIVRQDLGSIESWGFCQLNPLQSHAK